MSIQSVDEAIEAIADHAARLAKYQYSEPEPTALDAEAREWLRDNVIGPEEEEDSEDVAPPKEDVDTCVEKVCTSY